MTIIFDRFAIKVIASAGFCAAAIALSPHAAAVPLIQGGAKCLSTSAGSPAPVGADGAAAAPCSAVAMEASGVVGPVPAAPPIVPPLAPPVVPPIAPPVVPPLVPPVAPVVPAVPAAAPVVPMAGAPVAAGAPLVEMGGSGKGATTAPPPASGPQPGVPIIPGPQTPTG